MARTKFMFATDLHGSETVWRKFLNIAKIYDLDALILSGDMTGKIMVPIIKRDDGKYNSHLLGREYILSEEELPEYEEKVRMTSYLPYVIKSISVSGLFISSYRYLYFGL